ncbi:MAG: xanthine dehydrogenase family protein subunit M [Chloroflexi bacterium]|nr:xanthine dehydrogenase family protein subunit M [Chloroflexota bacterium]
MNSFDYHAPTSLAETFELLDAHGDDAHLMAGGTALVLLLQQGLVQPGHVVGLRDVPELQGVRRLDDGGLHIGALTTHRQAERSAAVVEYCAALAETFARVATVRIRNQGTVGGNLAHADPAQDPPPMLMSLGGSAVVASRAGERRISLDAFFVDYFETALQPGEVLVACELPPLAAGTRVTYKKFLPRTQDDYATVSVAAALRVGANALCADVRVSLGAAATTPVRARKVEEALRGQRLSPEAINAAAALVRDEVDPLDDLRGSAGYKREMARVWTQRALQELVDRAS